MAMMARWNSDVEPFLNQIRDDLKKGYLNHKKYSTKDYCKAYTACYQIATESHRYANGAGQLYTHFGDTIREFIVLVVLPALRDLHGELFLVELSNGKKKHAAMNKWMQRICMICDRFYVKHHSLPSLTKAGDEIFNSLILSEAKENVAQTVANMIDQERDGAEINQQLIKQCVALYEAAGMFHPDFEEKLLQSTKEYYKQKSCQWIGRGDGLSEYMHNARIVLEAERLRNYLNPDTHGRLVGAAENEILRSEIVLLGQGLGGALFLLWRE